MRDVHCGLDVFQADVVQETLHVVQRLDEGELERKQFDRKLETPFCGMSSDLLRRVDHELPLALRRHQVVLKHVLARDEAEVPGRREFGGQVEDVLRAFDVIGTDGRIEIAETETGADERVDRQVDAAHLGDIVAALGRTPFGPGQSQ